MYKPASESKHSERMDHKKSFEKQDKYLLKDEKEKKSEKGSDRLNLKRKISANDKT